MSTKLSLKEVLGRLDDAKAASPDQSDIGAVDVTLRATDIKQPVQLARFLRDNGLRLRLAHEALNRLSAGESVSVKLHPLKLDRLVLDLAALGVIADFGADRRREAAGFDATAVAVTVTDDRLIVALADGREISAPLAWFPRLSEATKEQRQSWRLIGRGHGIRWPAIDEDVSIASLLRAA